MKRNLLSINSLNETKIFTYEEAVELSSMLNYLSMRAKKDLALLNSQLSFVHNDSKKAIELQDKINNVLQTWTDKVRRLGTVPISLYKVRIKNNETYFLWEYQNENLIEI